jgi:DNA polymerase-3 subunit gamma/tau
VTPTVQHQALYRRWRAQTFSQIVGQEAVVETLRSAVRTDRVSHAVLFVGPRGTGKTSLARILAKALNCTDLRDGDPCDACDACVSIREGTTLDLVEIDAASNRGIDDVRELRERLAYPPGQLRRKVYILDEAHQITGPAWNALLKSIEEPPPFVSFMFASTEPSGFPAAILSRLQRFDVRRLTITEIEGKLARILQADGREAEPGAIRLIASLAAGGMRDAESMLDQLLSAGDGRIDESRVRDLLGLADAEVVARFVSALVDGDAVGGITILDELEERGRDTRFFLDQVVEVVRAELRAGLTTQANGSRSTARLALVARRLAAIDLDRAGVGGLRLQLELALLAAMGEPAPTARAAPPTPALSAAAPAVTPAKAVPTVAPTKATATAPRTAAPVAPEQRPPEPVVPSPPPEAAPSMAPASKAPALAPSPAEPSASEPPGGDLELLRARWSAIVAAVGPATRAVIGECRPMAVDGNIVTLGFPEAKSFLKDHAERKRPELEAALAGVLGRVVNVRTVATNVELAGPDDLIAEARRIFADDLADVAEVD